MLRKTLVGFVVLLIATSLMSSRRAEAHNIDLDKAWEVARDFARAIRKESNGNYLHYSTKCGRAFPGHNHIVKCDIEYQNAKDTKAGVYTCKEAIEVKFAPHGSRNTEYYNYIVFHTSGNKCGSRQPGVVYAH